ncbi:MAG: N-acetyltransferase [Nitrospirota bacterium]
MKIRKARIADLRDVHRIINDFAKKELMLPRSLSELYETLRDFVICENEGIVCGVCALHIMWEDLAEIRSLAVETEYQNKGIGKDLIKECLREAESLGIKKVFALTYNPEFFRKIGFEYVDKATLPQKIWGDCLKCPRFPECDEHAMIKNL